MRHLYRHVIIVIASIVLAVWAILPLDKKLRFGKDLEGGTTLIYQVTIDSGNPQETINRLIDVLKQRVDPGGVRDITFTPLDNNRIEISMPVADKSLRQVRAQFEAAKRQLTTGAIDQRTFDNKMALPPEARRAEIARVVGNDQQRAALFLQAAEKFDAFRQAARQFAELEPTLQQAVTAAQQEYDQRVAAEEAARRALESAKAAGGSEPTPEQLAVIAAAEQALTIEQARLQAARAALDEASQRLDAEARKPLAAQSLYQDARRAALASAISASALDRVLARATTNRVMRIDSEQTLASIRAAWDRITFPTAGRPRPEQLKVGQRVAMPAPRDLALQRLLDTYPTARDRILELVALHDEIANNPRGTEDVNDLKRILRGAGVLEFRIAVGLNERQDIEELQNRLAEEGPTRGLEGKGVRWAKINKEENWYDSPEQYEAMHRDPRAYFAMSRGLVGGVYDGEFYILLHDVAFNIADGSRKRLTSQEGTWRVIGANPTTDPTTGLPAIAFRMDAGGARLMGELTQGNIGKPMAIVLDDQVYTTANINSRIGDSGIITGRFSQAEIDYIVRVLAAGSLAGRLSQDPISETTVGPELGQDNLLRGLAATLWAFLLVAAYMIAYYFAGGLISVLALGINLLLILALMALNHAAFTLPGIAGIILTFGMAVDANVLIFERLREEVSKGNDLRTAVRLAYSKALSAIIDGNVTNLIVCVVLGFYGTPEIRGFAITMSIGVLTTLFCQLYVTRIIYIFLVEKLHFRAIGSMLPLAFPALQRLITPRIDWLRFRYVFFTVSTLVTVACIAVVVSRGTDLLDTEFRGGTRITVQLKEGETLTREQVQRAVREIAAANRGTVLQELDKAEVLALNPEADNVTANRFLVKTIVSDGERVADAIFQSEVLRPKLDLLGRLRFDGMDPNDPRLSTLPVLPITSPVLGDNFKTESERRLLAGMEDSPVLLRSLADFSGGAIIVINNITPPESLERLQLRFDRVRGGALGASDRRTEFIITRGTPDAVVSAMFIVRDDRADALTARGEWERVMRSAEENSEKNLAIAALKLSQSQAGVESFSPSVAETFRNQAIIAVVLSTLLIIIYVWVRFASFRYSMAAIITTLHDCIVAVGLLAMAELICNSFPGFAGAIGLLPFKIDLNVIASILTILGYSLNDTIVIMDRIRENRGKLPYASRAVVNNSINQTFSRTIMTGGSAIVASIVLYTIGGEAMRAFAFCFTVGVLTGTYSSVALAAPIVWVPRVDPTVGGKAPEPAIGATVNGQPSAGAPARTVVS
jgi:SecD/SecF fusion protein